MDLDLVMAKVRELADDAAAGDDGSTSTEEHGDTQETTWDENQATGDAAHARDEL